MQKELENIFFGQKIKPIIKALWVVIILIGSQSTLGFAWDLADTFNGLMIIPNLIGIILLSNEAVKMKNDYFKRDNVEKIKNENFGSWAKSDKIKGWNGNGYRRN